MNFSRQFFCAVAIVAAIVPGPVHGEDRAIPIAIADFDYRDGSGEVRDQTADHRQRLEAFTGSIRDALGRSGKYRVVALNCAATSCAAGAMRPEQLLEDAHRSGARLVLYGGIQKLSTLVQNAKAQVVDVDANKLVFDRLMTFRGDSDESWQRAEHFLVTELLSENLDSARP